MRFVISSVSDLETWIGHQGGEIREDDVRCLLDMIQGDDHPPWGKDWTTYLENIDLAESVLRDELVFKVTIDDLRKLRSEAYYADDKKLARLCRLALYEHDAKARRACIKVILENRGRQ